jgi:hypothetical protein
MDNNNNTDEILNSLQGIRRAQYPKPFHTIWKPVQQRVQEQQSIQWLWRAAAVLILFTTLNLASWYIKRNISEKDTNIENFAKEYGFTNDINM